MKILLITHEEWNDYTYSNGILTNWFSGFNADFAQIYLSPGLPNNNICHKYFQISDLQMVKSILKKRKAGCEVSIPKLQEDLEQTKNDAQRVGIYGFFKKVSLITHTPIMLLRDYIWKIGKIDETALSKFIRDFNPDVVFCPSMITPRMMMVENMVSKMTDAPFIGFTADDEASLQQYNWSPLYWLRRLYIHFKFANHAKKLYKYYWTFSEEQALDYTKKYGIPTSTLYKCGDFPSSYASKNVGNPIRMIYAGRLYCNRWKTLAEIGKALKLINSDREKIVLDVYPLEEPTNKQKSLLSTKNSIYIHKKVTSNELKKIYENADIAMHVESFDKKYRLETRVSFSTKIIDLMASTCAIMAICWNRHGGFQYLKAHDAAFCIDNYKDILPMLQHIVNNPMLIREYAEKAYQCGLKNHSREIIQKQLFNKFNDIITNAYNKRANEKK